MQDNIDFQYFSSPCFRPEKMDGSLAFPALYYKVLPFIKIACNETAIFGIVSPSGKMVRCIVAHMCNRIFEQYPELIKYDVMYSKEDYLDLNSGRNDPYGSHEDYEEYDKNGELIYGGPFRDYLSTLFLLEYFDKIINI